MLLRRSPQAPKSSLPKLLKGRECADEKWRTWSSRNIAEVLRRERLLCGVWQILQRGWDINGMVWSESVRGLSYFGSYKVRKKKWQYCQKFFVRGLLCTRKIVFCEEKVAILPFFLPRKGMVFSVLPHPLACQLVPWGCAVGTGKGSRCLLFGLLS